MRMGKLRFKKDMLGNEVKNLRQRLSNVKIIDDLEIDVNISLDTVNIFLMIWIQMKKSCIKF